MAFHWSLSDCKSPQVSMTLLSILVDLYNAVVWMVSARPLISKSSSPFTNPLGIVPLKRITICITVTFMFHSFFSTLARCDTVLGIRWMGVCVDASQRFSLSVLARNPHKGLARVISHETGRTREGRSQRSVGKREEKETVGMTEQSREGHSAEGDGRDQWAEGGSQKMKAGQRREKNRSQKDDF